ncbi:MAG: PrgI family protein [Patescibacteria group bacterium]
MQFQVPQFIEVEDKIFGPLTFKQFVYIGGGLGACYIMWRVLPIYLAGPLVAIIGGLTAGLAFFQLNGRPFIIGLENGFFFLLRSKLYLWNNARKKNVTPPVIGKAVAGAAQIYVPKLSEGKLHELSWSLDIKERVAQGIASDDDRRLMRTPQDLVAPIRTPQQELARLTGENS